MMRGENLIFVYYYFESFMVIDLFAYWYLCVICFCIFLFTCVYDKSVCSCITCACLYVFPWMMKFSKPWSPHEFSPSFCCNSTHLWRHVTCHQRLLWRSACPVGSQTDSCPVHSCAACRLREKLAILEPPEALCLRLCEDICHDVSSVRRATAEALAQTLTLHPSYIPEVLKLLLDKYEEKLYKCSNFWTCTWKVCECSNFWLSMRESSLWVLKLLDRHREKLYACVYLMVCYSSILWGISEESKIV